MMPKYRIESNYGTFVMHKTVEAHNQTAALLECGVMTTLMDAGWRFNESPDGEYHEAKLVPAISTDPGQASVCRDITRIMDNGTSSDGWDIGILESIDHYLRNRGFETIDMEDCE
jgi:hypothetical protein